MNWLATRKLRRNCLHHRQPTDIYDPDTGESLGKVEAKSFIKSVLIDMGMRKMFWCEECGETWIR